VEYRKIEKSGAKGMKIFPVNLAIFIRRIFIIQFQKGDKHK